jgi:Mycobacterium membrane protein/MMPL family
MRYARRGGVIIGVIVLVWLLIGMIAAWQRDYFKGGDTSCASAATVALTVITGPLNYAGVNPKATHSNTVMILVKGQQSLTLDAPARFYYNNLMYQLWRGSKHVHYIQDFWSDRTGPGGQSADATTAYIVLSLAGQQGEPLANESLEAVRHVVNVIMPPAGVKAYVIGPCQTGSGQEQPPITSSRQVQPPAIELKHVRYEVFGPAGAKANLNYEGVNGQPNRTDNVQLPWTIDYLTTLPSVDVNIVAQTDADQIGCRILVDGVLKDLRVKRGIPGAKAETDCAVKVENGRSLPK